MTKEKRQLWRKLGIRPNERSAFPELLVISVPSTDGDGLDYMAIYQDVWHQLGKVEDGLDKALKHFVKHYFKKGIYRR